jgi:hypothetical protein
MQNLISSIYSPDVTRPQNLSSNVKLNLTAFIGNDGQEYASGPSTPNPTGDRIGGRFLNSYIRKKCAEAGQRLRQKDLDDINEDLKSAAHAFGFRASVWYRVAQIPNGIEIDLGDDRHRRISVTPNNVEIVNSGSQSIFIRNPHMGCISVPEDVSSGNLSKFDKYLNMTPESKILALGWLTFSIAQPKVENSKFPILVLSGSQGTGKTVMSKLLLKFADPSSIGVRTFPSNQKELAIACQSSHVLAYDNLRFLSPVMADALCIAATGGSITVRQLYTDADVMAIRLHGAVILNGLHPFINQSDLAQRCLTIELLPISKDQRQTDAELQEQLHRDYPDIYFGLLDLIAKVFAVLPDIQVKEAERMAEFSKWLAAMEVVQGVPEGTYQKHYSDQIVNGQLDALQDSLFGNEILAFGKKQVRPWTGTPTQLYQALSEFALPHITKSREWPDNAIALSKRLMPLVASLDAQGISVQFKRGKNRQIIITNQAAEDALY